MVRISFRLRQQLLILIFSTIIVPSSPPQNLFGYSRSSTLIDLSWQLPPAIDINGVIQYYSIVVQELETGRLWNFIHVEPEISIGSLHPYYNYQCHVAASTIGFGLYTDYIVIQTEEAGIFVMCLSCILADTKHGLINPRHMHSEGYSRPVCLCVFCLLLLFWLCVQYSILPKAYLPTPSK